MGRAPPRIVPRPAPLDFTRHTRYAASIPKLEILVIGPWQVRAAGPCPDFGEMNMSAQTVAKTTPLEFIRQVQAETKKVVWPTRRETIMTGVMVVIMTTLLGLFFFIVDTGFEAIVHLLLSLAK